MPPRSAPSGPGGIVASGVIRATSTLESGLHHSAVVRRRRCRTGTPQPYLRQDA
ncbi:predicted protein [Streptomyces viridochromogenes DSM 40736]|uniref:Predicted protein n=1 Tax=Streptomyces viridochromogenes (strain DSM 40736 / JCM 4977 / BCRC 1201 / Tue 494) TaxID=591159 RepID=D9XBW6_STRVT|nr:predicted protein [Streptomyces viridochromogenes DSM 40736]